MSIGHILLIVLLVYLVFGLLHQNNGKTYGYKLDLFIDLFFGAAIWCKPGVTISSEVGLAIQRTNPPMWAKILNKFLDSIQKDHTSKAVADDIIRAENAISYLKTKQV